MDCLVVSAHTDDVETGASGLMIKLNRAGHKITSVVATSARHDTYFEGRPQRFVREEESIKSHNCFGATPIFLTLPTQSLLLTTPYLFEEIKKIFEKHKPDLILTHWPVDVHPDHQAVSIVTSRFCLERGVNTEFFYFEVRAGTTIPYKQTIHFCPTHYVDISDILEEKKKILFFHRSQNPQGLWDSNLESWRFRGEQSDVRFAEGYVRVTRNKPLHEELKQFFIETTYRLPKGLT